MDVPPKPHDAGAEPDPPCIVAAGATATPEPDADGQPGDGPAGRPGGLATIFSDYSAAFAARGASVAFGLGFAVLAARILSPSGYGELAYLTVVATLVATIASAWTAAAVPRYGREEIERHGSMVGVTWARLILTAPLLTVCSALALALSLGGVLPSELSFTAVLVALGFGACLIVQEHVVGVLQAAGRMKLSAVAITAQQVIALIAAAVLLTLGLGASPVVLGLVLALAALCGAVPLLPAIWRLGMWPPAFDRTLMRRLLIFSVPLLAFTFSQYVIRWVDFAVIRAYGTTSDVGIYAIAYQPYSALQSIVATSTTVLIPLFVSLRLAGRQRLIVGYLRRVVPQVTFLGAVGVGLVAPLCSPATTVLFGRAYADAGQPLSILVVSVLFLLTASLVGPILVVYERTRQLGKVNLVAAGVNVVSDLALIGPGGLGSAGAAIATCAATAVLAAGYHRAGARCLCGKAGLHPALLLPAFAGVLPLFVLSGPVALATCIIAVLVSAVGVVILVGPFQRQDADLILALDAPDALKRVALRAVELFARMARR